MAVIPQTGNSDATDAIVICDSMHHALTDAWKIKLKELSSNNSLHQAAVKPSVPATEKALNRHVFVIRKFCSK